jgi:phosphogluconate dehydratase
LRNGDIVRLDSLSGEMNALVDEEEWRARANAPAPSSLPTHGTGRELFSAFRGGVTTAEQGAISIGVGTAI